MEIRLGKLTDAEDIAKNNVSLADETEEVNISYQATLSGVKNVLSDSDKGFYVVAVKDSVIGQLMITFEWSDWRNKNIWWIQSVYIKEKFRKSGMFKKLYQKVKEMAEERNVAILRLYVHKENRTAKEVYRKIGMNKSSYEIFESTISR